MIGRLHIKNFKSLEDNKITINKLTLLTGLNSSGKSSVIQGIRMMNNFILQKNPYIPELGAPQEVINKNSNQLNFDVYSDKDKVLATCFLDSEGNGSIEYEDGEDGRNLLNNISYVEAGRFGSRVAIPVDPNNNLFSSNGDNILYFIDQHANEIVDDKVVHDNSDGNTLFYNIRAWLKEISPNLKFDYTLQKIANSSYSTFDEHRATNVGFGLSYTLPVIVALLYATINKDTLVLIENPEAHLHPKGQAMIANLICKATEAGAQIIVETHSDHLFDGVRVYAKRNKGFAKNVDIHWFALNEYGNTEIVTPVLDDNGRLDQWPADMFEQFDINASSLL